MKRKILKLLLLPALAALLVLPVACGGGNDPAAWHEHFFPATWEKDNDDHWHECSCGEKSDTEAHKWVRGQVVEADCENDGSVEYTCSVCGVDKTTVTPAAHALGDKIEKVKTCTEDGIVAHYHCSKCDKDFDEDGEELSTVVIPAGHVLGEKLGGTAPDCTQKKNGEAEHFHCSACGKDFDEDGDEIEDTVIPYVHTLGEKIEKAKTCTEDGIVAHYHCSVCDKDFDEDGEELSTVVVPAGHELTEHAAVEETCTVDGNIFYKSCSGCGKNFDEAGEELEEVTITARHIFTNHYDAECDRPGCDHTRTVVHDISVKRDANGHWKECAFGENCPENTVRAPHTYDDDADAVCNGEECGFERTPYHYEWTEWASVSTLSDAPSRYNYRGKATAEGIFINVIQHVDSYVPTAIWENSTHVELFVFNDSFGYGAGGTYFGLFMNGNGDPNSKQNIKTYNYYVTVTDRGEQKTGAANGYRYVISYEVLVSFENTSRTRLMLMSMTPGETGGYEGAILNNRELSRQLYTEKTSMLDLEATGFVKKNYGEEIRSNAPDRFAYSAASASDGIYMKVVQNVDNIVMTGDGFTAQTHVEAEIWKTGLNQYNDAFFAFFVGSTVAYTNATNAATTFMVTTTDHGEDHVTGGFPYRYTLTYHIYIGFVCDSSVAKIWVGHFIPGESGGMGSAVAENRDGRAVVTETPDTHRPIFGLSASGGFTFSGFGGDYLVTEAPDRYAYRAHIDGNGIYLNVVQYVDAYSGNDNVWDGSNTHFEYNIWGSKTFFGSMVCTGAEYNFSGGHTFSKATIIDHGAADNRDQGYKYRYEIRYEIYIYYENGGSEATMWIGMALPNESGGFGTAVATAWDTTRPCWCRKAVSTPQQGTADYKITSGGITAIA